MRIGIPRREDVGVFPGRGADVDLDKPMKSGRSGREHAVVSPYPQGIHPKSPVDAQNHG